MVAGYKKTNTPEIDMQVRGQFRTRLVYRLLSEDILEGAPGFAGEDNGGKIDDRNLQGLCQYIQARTGLEYDLIEETIKSFRDSGFIKTRGQGNQPSWYWTINRFVDLPEYPA
ncbi:MAG: hypothetical protein QMD32_03785, partial [Smithellaceae bacterium]|nr:hypothetical protein [Smithellaceae bacterium]